MATRKTRPGTKDDPVNGGGSPERKNTGEHGRRGTPGFAQEVPSGMIQVKSVFGDSEIVAPHSKLVTSNQEIMTPN